MKKDLLYRLTLWAFLLWAIPALALTFPTQRRFVGFAGGGGGGGAPPVVALIASNGSTSTTIYTSSDGVTFTAQTTPSATGGPSNIAYSADLNQFAAVYGFSGSTNTTNLLTSNGAATLWTTRTVATDQWSDVFWSHEKLLWMAVAFNSSNTSTSPDGMTWTTQGTDTDGVSLTYAGGTIGQWVRGLSVSPANAIRFSTNNGTTWSTPTTGVTANIGANDIIYSSSLGQILVVTGSNGTSNALWTSTDGSTYTARTTPATQLYAGGCWSPALAQYVVVGTNAVATSSNGTTWTAQTAANSDGWKDCIWSNGLNKYFAVANSGASTRIMSSPNGTTWTGVGSFTTQAFVGVATSG
jgi:hypothetical protein